MNAEPLIATLLVAARVVLALVFLTSGFSKVRHVDRLRETIERYIHDSFMRRSAVIVLPTIEIVLGTAWLAGAYLQIVAPTTVVLLVVFSWVVASRGGGNATANSSCGCGGLFQSSVGVGTTVARNALLSAFAILSVPLDLSPWSPTSIPNVHPSVDLVVLTATWIELLLLVLLLISELSGLRSAAAQAHRTLTMPHLPRLRTRGHIGL